MAAKARKKAAKRKGSKRKPPKKASKRKAKKKAVLIDQPQWYSELGLTPKMESFAQHYVVEGVAARAYRHAYDAENMKDSTIWRRAHELLRNGKVAARVRELRTAIADAAGIDKKALTSFLIQEREMAIDNGDPQHATKATKELAHLLGYKNQKVEISFPDLPELTPEEVAALGDEADDQL